MTFKAATYREAAEKAQHLRALYGRDGWVVRIARPLFKGDLYLITVGI